MRGIVPETMSTPLYKCANCGAIIHRLNIRCGYCNHWNVDPTNPQDPPSAATPPAAPAPAPAPVAAPVPAPVAPIAAAPAAAAAAASPLRRLFGSKPAIAAPAPAPAIAAPAIAERRPVGVASGAKARPSKEPVALASKSRVLKSVVAEADAAPEWDRGRKLFNSRSAPSSHEDQELLARVQAVMAVAYWVATSDDDEEMDDDEYDALVDTFAELLGEEVDEEELEATIAAWDEAIEEDEDAFVAEAVEAIGAGPMRRQALEIAAIVAAADDDLSDIEEETLAELAIALGYGDRESERIIKRALSNLDE